MTINRFADNHPWQRRRMVARLLSLPLSFHALCHDRCIIRANREIQTREAGNSQVLRFEVAVISCHGSREVETKLRLVVAVALSEIH